MRPIDGANADRPRTQDAASQPDGPPDAQPDGRFETPAADAVDEAGIVLGVGGDPDDPFRRPKESVSSDDPVTSPAVPPVSSPVGSPARFSADDDFDDLDLDALLGDEVISDDGSSHDDYLLDDDDDSRSIDIDDPDVRWNPQLPADDDRSPETGADSAPEKPRRHLIIDDFDGMDEPGPGRAAGTGLAQGAASAPSAPPTGSPAGGVTPGPVNKVIIDGSDDLPDAISLSDTRREGGNLLIGDDDDLSALVLPDEKPKMNPKVRQRRISVRRGKGRKRLKWVLGIGIPLMLVVAALAVMASPLFSVETVTVDGAVHSSAEQIEAIVGPLRNKPVLTIDTQKIERQLRALPWVRRASVDAQFPSSLKVSLVERVPAAAYVGTDGSWRIIDIDGGVIDIVPDGAQPADFLPIFGPGPDLAPGQNAGAAFQTLAQLAATLDALPTLRPVIVSISVVGPDINLALTTEATVNLGTAGELRQKLAVLLTLLSDPACNIDKIVSINVSDPTKPAVEPGCTSA